MIRCFILIIVTLLSASIPAFASEWFVSPAGNDSSGNGTIQSPYKTIQHVLDSVAATGDTITLRNGTYQEEVRIRMPNITLRSRPGEWARIAIPPSIDPDNSPVGVIFDIEADGGKLQRVEVSGGFYAVDLFSAWEWDSTPLDNDTATNILIEDCIIHDTGRDCIKIPAGCDNVTIRRCEIYNSGVGYPPGTPSDDKNAEGIDVVNSDNVVIQDCYIHDTATTGVYIKGGSMNSMIERVKVENCGEMGIGVGFDTSPDWFDTTANPEYYENISGIVRNCVVINTTYAGIALYGSKDAIVHNNTLINTAKTGHGCIYFGLAYKDWEDYAGRPPNTNPRIFNNIILQTEPIDTPVVSIRYADDLGGMSALAGNPAMNNNCYFRTNGNCTFEDGRPGSPLENGSLAQWKTHISNEQQSFESQPRLDNEYRLLEGSPCIDTGNNQVPGGLPSTDKDNNPRMVNGVVDMGAYEYSGSGPAPEPETSCIILTPQNPSVTVQGDRTVTIYGCQGSNHITIETGVTARLLHMIGNNEITIKANASNFMVRRSGSHVTFSNASFGSIKLPATASSQTIRFNDFTGDLMIRSGKVFLKDQEITLQNKPL